MKSLPAVLLHKIEAFRRGSGSSIGFEYWALVEKHPRTFVIAAVASAASVSAFIVANPFHIDWSMTFLHSVLGSTFATAVTRGSRSLFRTGWRSNGAGWAEPPTPKSRNRFLSN